MGNGSVVLLSGGLDSAVAALEASRVGPVHALTFEYGQRHWVEVSAAKRIAGIIGAKTHITVNIGGQGVGLPAALVTPGDKPIVGAAAIVPGRNIVFLTYAAARAQALGVRNVVLGVTADDQTVFPDCRPDFVVAMQHALRAGLDFRELTIITPFVLSTKAEVVKRATGELRAASWSCYSPKAVDGRKSQVTDNVKPCGACGACQVRARGFAEAGLVDPTIG